MYRYTSSNCFFKSEEGDSYMIEMETPFHYETEEKASRDTTVYRFRKEDKKVKLIAYEKEWVITDKLPDGRKAVRPIPIGDPVSKYTYRQFIDMGGKLMKKTGDPDRIGGMTSLERTDKSFDELFPNLEPGAEVCITRGTCGGIRYIDN